MIAGWLLYCLAVSALLALAAAAIDSVLTARSRPARWVWIAAIVGTLIIPAAAYVWQQRRDALVPGAGEAWSGGIEGRFPSSIIDAPRKPVSLGRVIGRYRLRTPEISGTDRIVVAIAVSCIVIAGVRVAFDSLLLYRGRRAWRPEIVDGASVLVSSDLGPAIVGLIEPRIVLPQWTLGLDADERTLMLVHEREHVRTSDSRLTTAALLAVISMPWNPVLWWAFRRLRTAIEVDCDRRVLRAFPDVKRYGRLLVDVAQRAQGSSLAIAGFSERAAPLARRIHAMTSARGGLSVRDAGAGVVGACALVASAAVMPPAAPTRVLAEPRHATPFLAKNVADSIVINEAHTPLIGAATNLPESFAVQEQDPGSEDLPRGAGCATRLRDDRDGTTLLRLRASTQTLGVAQRGDTAWTRIGSTGYYGVMPTGRFGVQKGQLLRVGCGGMTHVTVAGQKYVSNALSTLDLPGDDRARRIGEAIQSTLHVEPAAVELFARRLNIIITDTLAIGRSDDARWRFVNEAGALSRRLLGRVAMPETVIVAIRTRRDDWHTMRYYESTAK